MMVKRNLTRTVYGYRVLHAVSNGGTTAKSYGPWRDMGSFIAAQINEELAPGCHRAKVILNLPGLGIHAWQWRHELAFDDRLAIVSGHPDAADRHCPFAGFVTDVEWGYQASDEHVTINCVSAAFRLLRDTIVAGRWMPQMDGLTMACFTGQPCEFNAGGRPNMYPLRRTVNGCYIPVFTYDDDPAGGWWTAPLAIEYLQAACNGGQEWLKNFTITEAAREGWPEVQVKVEGLDGWTALGRVCEKAGADVYEMILNDGAGMPASEIKLVTRGMGLLRSVRHQPLAADGAFQMLDLNKTNLLSASIAESITSAVTRPIVAGAASKAEITIELGKAWDPALLPACDAGEIRFPSKAGGTKDESAEYVRRYCVGGATFADYVDAGRLWDANTDGRYLAAPYSLIVPDVAALADLAAGSLPKMPFAPQPCITRLGVHKSTSARYYLEWSWDGGTTWEQFKHAALLPDRLGVWINAENMAGIMRPSLAANDLPLQDPENFFYLLANSPSQVRLRLTCSIILPIRSAVRPALRPTAGSVFETALWYDAGSLGADDYVASSSRFYASALGSDERDDTDELAALAAWIQDTAETGLLEGQLPIEWPDEDIMLTDRIRRIGGLGYDLKMNAGNAKKAPRVVGRTLLLTHDTYSMALKLETQRGAGLI